MAIASPETVASLPTPWPRPLDYRLRSTEGIRLLAVGFPHRNFDSWNHDEEPKAQRSTGVSLQFSYILNVLLDLRKEIDELHVGREDQATRRR